MTAPVQRTETCPPVTLTLRADGVGKLAGLGLLLPDGAGDGERVLVVAAFVLAVVGVVASVVDAEGAGVAPVPVGTPLGVALGTVGPSEGIDSVAPPGSLMSRPAWLMANQAAADTPATVTSQIIAIATTVRAFTFTDSPPCRHCVTFASPRHTSG